MGTQLRYFFQDVRSLLGRHKRRILVIWFTPAFVGIWWYRLERSLYLLLGKSYGIIRIPLLPINALLLAYSRLDINYKADIGPGLAVKHPSLGVVVSGYVIAGRNLSMVGGNAIGVAKRCKQGEFIIGDNCTLSANAVVLGPLTLANDILVGASSCVVKSCLTDGAVLAGVPAKQMVKETEPSVFEV
jgi:serine acetyltransferase